MIFWFRMELKQSWPFSLMFFSLSLRIFRQRREMGNGEWLVRQQFLGMFTSWA